MMDDKVIDAIIATQIQSFHTNGVWGINNGGLAEVPELMTI